jgi:hypothetical protein
MVCFLEIQAYSACLLLDDKYPRKVFRVESVQDVALRVDVELSIEDRGHVHFVVIINVVVGFEPSEECSLEVLEYFFRGFILPQRDVVHAPLQ